MWGSKKGLNFMRHLSKSGITCMPSHLFVDFRVGKLYHCRRKSLVILCDNADTSIVFFKYACLSQLSLIPECFGVYVCFLSFLDPVWVSHEDFL